MYREKQRAGKSISSGQGFDVSRIPRAVPGISGTADHSKVHIPCSRAYIYVPLQNIRDISFAPLSEQEQQCSVLLDRSVVSRPVLISDVSTIDYYKSLKSALKPDFERPDTI